MIEKIAHGGKLYWGWIIFLLVCIGIGVCAYVNQLNNGLILTGMSRDVNWGLYIAQFTFFVGVAASGVMVAIPVYLHNYKEFGPFLIFGEFLAVAAVLVALLFVIVDLGYPARLFNVLLYPSPHSILFFDMCVLSSYLIVNIIVGWAAIYCERKGIPPFKWAKVLAIIAIPLAIGIHTVTAFIYIGNPGRAYWGSAIVVGRFLASAFAAGPALLIMVCFIMRKFTKFDISDKALNSFGKIVAYAMCTNIFFFLLEIFASFYPNSKAHMAPIEYLFFGLDGLNQLGPFMWVATVCAFVGVTLLIVPKFRHNHKTMVAGLFLVFLACWIDKGLGFTLGGFTPNNFGEVVSYIPNPNEICVIIGVFAIGALVLTLLYKIVIGVREANAQDAKKLSEVAGH